MCAIKKKSFFGDIPQDTLYYNMELQNELKIRRESQISI